MAVRESMGTHLSPSGRWKMDARYGRQFSVEKFEKNSPPRYMEFTNIRVPVWSKEVAVSNEKNTKKNRQSILPFPADRGAGKCTFAPFLQETGRKICGKSERNRIYIRDSRHRKDLLH